MSDTKRLDEGTIRRFMKLAKIEGLADGFVEQNSVLKEGSKKGGRSRYVAERADDKRAQGRVEEKKDKEGEEVEEGSMHYEAEGEMDEQDELMGDMGSDEMGGEGGMEMGGEGGDAKAIIARVINAIGEEFPELGIQVEEEAGADDMDMEEPEDDEEMDMEDDEEALGGDEEGDGEGEEDEGEGEEEEMEETLSDAARKQLDAIKGTMKQGIDKASASSTGIDDPEVKKALEEPPKKKTNESISLQEAILARVKARLLAEARRGGKAMTAKEKMKMKKKAKSGKPTDEVKKHGKGGAGLATKGNSKTVGHGGYRKASGRAMEETSGGAGLASKGKNNHKGYKDSDVGGVAKSSGKSGNLTPAGKPKKSHGV